MNINTDLITEAKCELEDEVLYLDNNSNDYILLEECYFVTISLIGQ